MPRYTHPTLVIGGEHNALGVIRNLGRLGIPVYCLVDTPPDFARYSKYCLGAFNIPGAESNEQVLKPFLKRVRTLKLPSRHPIYLHPTSDLSLLTVSRIQHELKGYVTMVPSQTVAETLILKHQFYNSLVKAGIPHPQTIVINEDSIAHSMVKQAHLSLPVFVKPSLSQVFTQQFHRKGFLARNWTELQKYLHICKHHHHDVMIQEIIPGPPINGYIIRGYFTQHAQLRFLFASNKLRQPQMFSIESAQVSIPIKGLVACCSQIITYLKKLNYRGIFHAEVKWDFRDKTFKLLEVNPRSGGGNSHPDACGANHILLSYLEAVGEQVHTITKYQAGIYSTYCFLDLLSLFVMARTKRRALTQVLRSYLRTRDWIFAHDDLCPFLYELSMTIKQASKSIRNNLSHAYNQLV